MSGGAPATLGRNPDALPLVSGMTVEEKIVDYRLIADGDCRH
jgi:hypothetical protein